MARGTKQIDVAEVRRNCLGLRMRLASRVITRLYDDALRPLGLRGPQFAMLAFAEERGTLRQADLCQELQLDDSTLSRNLDRMRAQGWLEMHSGEDAREHPYQITAQGRDLLRRALPAWSRAQNKARELLGRQGQDVLRSFAERFGLQE